MIVFASTPEPAPVTHPTITLGGGTWCTFNYDSLISSGLAIVVTVVFAIVIARRLDPSRPGRLQGIMEWLFSYVRRNVNENSPDASGFVVPLASTNVGCMPA